MLALAALQILVALDGIWWRVTSTLAIGVRKVWHRWGPDRRMNSTNGKQVIPTTIALNGLWLVREREKVNWKKPGSRSAQYRSVPNLKVNGRTFKLGCLNILKAHYKSKDNIKNLYSKNLVSYSLSKPCPLVTFSGTSNLVERSL